MTHFELLQSLCACIPNNDKGMKGADVDNSGHSKVY